jgi:hypothetical protein
MSTGKIANTSNPIKPCSLVNYPQRNPLSCSIAFEILLFRFMLQVQEGLKMFHFTNKFIRYFLSFTTNDTNLTCICSGKTSLAQSMSTIASTAAFDKNPQSKERGITLDLGFSSFAVDSPDHLKDKFDKVQYTLVDCPGHGKPKLL